MSDNIMKHLRCSYEQLLSLFLIYFVKSNLILYDICTYSDFTYNAMRLRNNIHKNTYNTNYTYTLNMIDLDFFS